MLLPVWLVLLQANIFLGITMWATPGVCSFTLRSLRKSPVRLLVLEEPRWLHSASNRILSYRPLLIASKSSHPFRKCAKISMTSVTESSLVDSNSSSTTGGDANVASDVPTVIVRSTSTGDTVYDTASRTESVAIYGTIEQRVERTLFREILPQILSNANASIKNATQESSKSQIDQGMNDATIVLGVSGGCDSVALLRILHKVLFGSPSSETNASFLWNMIVVHFDHQQRQEESDQDRLFVQSLCEQLNVPCFVYKWNERLQPSHSSSTSQPYDTAFSQATARHWRRSTMQQLLSEQLQTRRVSYRMKGDACPPKVFGMMMTAHHKDDSDETLLLKLLRGVHVTNIAGLSSIQPCNDQIDDFDDEDFASSANQSRPTFTDTSSLMYWVRPLIHVRKEDIVQFLRSNEYDWREDCTNQSNKYLRNRVRNELIPLLQDMMGGSYETLERRIDNLQQQSLEVRQYLNDRVQEHIKAHVCNGMYLLPERMSSEVVDLIMKEALYSWTLAQTKGYHVTYEQMQRVYRQLTNFPHHKQWQLNLGQHWNIIRYGDALRLTRVDDLLWKDSTDGFDPNSIIYRGKVCVAQTSPPSSSDDNPRAWLCIRMPKSMLESSYHFIQSTVGDWSEDRLQFTPPWKSKNSPIRVNEFLRGQRVPMHMRADTPIVVMIRHSHAETDVKLVSAQSQFPPTLIAVFISTRSQWLIDREFYFAGDERNVCNTSSAQQMFISTHPIS